MADSAFDRETLLDVSVNLVPMVIILFFTLLLLFASPFAPNLFLDVVALGLHLVPFVLLGLLTYVSATVIEKG
ncbi:DUF6684 family protein [Halorussus halobius]|uniref:DUF6684 family protein n=1 Tax=Halorussus halobius TaxID=1710537 RepID=UPI0010923547|nr:DUF6684 family protein [Halorussus halobius]